MEHFFQNIDGWFNCEPLYKEMVQDAKPGAVFVEVGCWLGRSAAFMAVEIANSGKDISFYAVDNFKGSKEHATEDAVVHGTLLRSFLENMQPASGHYTVCVGDSAAMAGHFQDQSIDFCYIDASHEYEDVKADILAWLSKMKPGALLAGDDLNYYEGVRRAVGELLPDFVKDDNIWRYTCPST